MKPTDELPVIFADRVQSLNYDGPDMGEVFADAGTSIELVTGNITSTGLVVDGTTGDVSIRGEVTATAFALVDGSDVVGELTLSPISAGGYSYQTGLDMRGESPDAANQLAWATEVFGTATVSRVGLTSIPGTTFGLPQSNVTLVSYADSGSPANNRGELYISQSNGTGVSTTVAVRGYSTFADFQVSTYYAGTSGLFGQLRLISSAAGTFLTTDARLGAWTALPLNSGGGWSNYGLGFGIARYRRFGDIVHLEGLVQCSPAGVGTVIGTLPAGFRPASQKMFAVRIQTSVNGDVTARLDITTAGSVVLNVAGGYSGSVGYLSLDGVSFGAV